MLRIKEKREMRSKLRAAREELRQLQLNLEEAYSAFNAASDPDILEACILEIAALRSRYSAALRNIKTLDGDIIKWQLR